MSYFSPVSDKETLARSIALAGRRFGVRSAPVHEGEAPEAEVRAFSRRLGRALGKRVGPLPTGGSFNEVNRALYTLTRRIL